MYPLTHWWQKCLCCVYKLCRLCGFVRDTNRHQLHGQSHHLHHMSEPQTSRWFITKLNGIKRYFNKILSGQLYLMLIVIRNLPWPIIQIMILNFFSMPTLPGFNVSLWWSKLCLTKLTLVSLSETYNKTPIKTPLDDLASSLIR